MSRYKPYPAYNESGVEWPGQVPDHWAVKRLKFSLKLISEKRTCTERPVALEHIEAWTGRLIKTDTKFEGDGICFQKSDILFGKLRPYLAKVYLADSPGEAVGDFFVIRPNHSIYPQFAQYQLLSNAFINIVDSSTFGAKMPRASWDFLGNMSLISPPYDEQHTVATYLAHETARIDALLEKKGRFIELLQEKRQALITQAVTKGLDPNVKLKDSGVKWLGQVPEHWTVCHLQYVIINIEQGWSPECHSYPAEPGQWGILKSGCVNGGVYNNNENKALPEELSPKPQYEVKAGDILMSRASGSPELIGSVALVANTQDKLMLSDKIFRIQCAVKMNPAFFVNMLNSSALRSQIMHAISGAEGLANNLPQAHIKKFWVTCPPLSEQQTIVSILDQNIARIDALITATQRSIELLKERRAALITAAVTGQIDLRDSATGEGEIP